MEVLSKGNLWIFVIAMLWTLPWKGYSLWTASRMNHKRWFIALIIFNTFGLLDIFYIFYIAKKTPKEVANVLKTRI